MVLSLFFFFLQLKAASSEEPTKETSAEEETAKVFLDKILRDVCRDVDTRQSQHKEQLGGGQGTF